MNDLKISVENLSIVQPDFEYLSVIEGEAWVEYNQQKFWLDFVFDGEQLFYTDLKDKLELVPSARDFDNEDEYFEAQEKANELYHEIDCEIFDEIINQLVERFPKTLEELKQKRSEQENNNEL